MSGIVGKWIGDIGRGEPCRVESCHNPAATLVSDSDGVLWVVNLADPYNPARIVPAPKPEPREVVKPAATRGTR